jgi:hypothetical protein
LWSCEATTVIKLPAKLFHLAIQGFKLQDSLDERSLDSSSLYKRTRTNAARVTATVRVPFRLSQICVNKFVKLKLFAWFLGICKVLFRF